MPPPAPANSASSRILAFVIERHVRAELRELRGDISIGLHCFAFRFAGSGHTYAPSTGLPSRPMIARAASTCVIYGPLRAMPPPRANQTRFAALALRVIGFAGT